MSNPQSLAEFALIREFFSSGFARSTDTILGVGDDCSIISSRADFELVQSIDTQVADIHFPASAPAYLIAQRALRCAASDLAAMGAIPQGFHLAISLPHSEREWLEEFSRGLKDAANQFNLDLLGGDTTKSKQLVISISVQGWVPTGSALRRDRAQVGDDIWVTDKIGLAALALADVLKNPATTDGLAQAYYFPNIQMELGQLLRPLAHACMDISDGLLQDAAHIAKASHVTLQFEAAAIPTAAAFLHADWWHSIGGGDDYQLLFTAAPTQRHALSTLQQRFTGLSRVGQVLAAQQQAVQLVHNQEILSLPEQIGFQHF